MDLLVAEEDLLPEPEEYSRNMELAFWSTEKHEQKRNGYPVVFRYQKASEIFREFQSMAAKRGHGASSFEMQANGQVVLFINGAGGAGSGHCRGSGLCGGNGGTGEKYGLLHTETECVQRFL